ncbi:MAG: hypothetical protein IME96_03175 [Proteobacteria bacterium]|nr:hypothetical protein [Pseudomonadota bacterium]
MEKVTMPSRPKRTDCHKKKLPFLGVTVALCVINFGICAAIEPEKMGALHLHPVDIEVPQSMKLPEGFIAGAGNRLTCKTCHPAEGLKDIPLDEINRDAGDFLRGGPYHRLTDFCYRCHKKEGYGRKNIHKMLDGKGKLIKDNCLYCHETAPDPEKVKNMSEVKFKLPPEKLCIGCHLKTPHFNALNHLKKPSKEMKKVMESSQKDLPVLLPLDSEGRVMCVTCHSPHEKGVIDPDKPAGKQVADADVEKGIEYADSSWNEVFAADKEKRLNDLTEKSGKTFKVKYMEIKKELLLRLPAKDGTLCLACHRFKK